MPTRNTTRTTPTEAVAPPSTPARTTPVGTPGDGEPTPPPHTCKCGARWGGARTAHCATCHRSMSGVTGFDQHRRDGKCVHPTKLGMVKLPGRPYECWGTSSDTDEGGEQ